MDPTSDTNLEEGGSVPFVTSYTSISPRAEVKDKLLKLRTTGSKVNMSGFMSKTFYKDSTTHTNINT